MKTRLKKLPSGLAVNIVYVSDMNGSAAYLHHKRSKTPKSKAMLANSKLLYDAMLLTINNFLCDGVKSQAIKFDTFVVAPSSCDDSAPYAERINDAFSMRDISNLFRKQKDYKAIDDEGGIKAALEAITYNSDNRENEIGALLILDECVGTGKTVNAVILHLQANGMNTDVQILIATPLLIV